MPNSPLPFLFPFFRPDDRGRPMVFGTGFLLQVSSCHFLVSAAHVFDDGCGAIYLAEGLITGPCQIDIHLTPAPGGRRADDILDLGVALLSSDFVARLRAEGHDFIKPGHLDVDDLPNPETKYCFTGFPASQQNCFNFSRRVVRLKPMEYALFSVDNERLKAAGWLPDLHLAGVFERESMLHPERGRITAPEPLGLSGGPVWTVRNGVYTLVGVGIEWDDASKMLVATRIGALVPMLKQRFPATIPYLRESRYLGIRIEE